MQPRRPKVLLAMSGGVDSSVAAALLIQQGYDVVGCFMRLGSPGETLDELTPHDAQADACDPAKVKIGHQGCCSVGDAADARAVAAELAIPLYVVNFKKDFGRIMDYFTAEYTAGRTPNPCVRCNDWLKFGKLHDYARQIGADLVASGHYARITPATRHPEATAPAHELRRGRDLAKDQSYVLFGVPRRHLARMLLPIGDYETKAEVRDLAQTLGLPVFDKPDSQEICFVPDQDYASFIERRNPQLARTGTLIDEAGKTIGTHTGHHRFTIGQRRGVGVALGYPIYVLEKDPQANTVTVGTTEALRSASCSAAEANWLTDPPPIGAWQPCLARHRYNAEAVPARFRRLEDHDHSTPSAPNHSGRTGRFEVRFHEPERAVTPGQAIVLYQAQDPDLVLGGGWIESAARD